MLFNGQNHQNYPSHGASGVTNSISYMVPWAHMSLQRKWHLDWFSHTCWAHSPQPCNQHTDTHTHTQKHTCRLVHGTSMNEECIAVDAIGSMPKLQPRVDRQVCAVRFLT